MRAIEERKMLPVGAVEHLPVDVRLIAATNQDILKDIHTNRFREELYYRISVVSIHLPPLRERKEDIPLLVEYFLKTCSSELGKSCESIQEEALRILMEYNWRGNVREL